jgi:hypothetical protein
MINLELLFIRTCKSQNPEKRIKSVYRRFYLDSGKFVDNHLLDILSKIVDKHLNITNTQMINLLNPDTSWMHLNKSGETPYSTRVMRILISEIRHSSIDDFEGFISPRRYRN